MRPGRPPAGKRARVRSSRSETRGRPLCGAGCSTQTAVRWLLRALDLESPDVAPLFFGDDVTDEDAFSELQGDGIGVVVAVPGDDPERMTAAGFRVDDPGEVLAVLERLCEQT